MKLKLYKYERADTINFNSFQNLVLGQYNKERVISTSAHLDKESIL
tara:strand:+ start:201 stop:338 length:138 start_codon:yes stop_codon:yes gene_type:complete